MVWASIAITMPGTIHFIVGKLLGKGYRDLLRDIMLPNARQLLGRNFYFLEDNDPKHGGPRGSVVVKNFIRTNSIRRMSFSPQSPDLNPIENFWSKLKLQVNNRNLEELRTVIREEFYDIDRDYILSLIHSMPSRLNAVIRSRAGYTKY